ncbi:MAG: HEAT repeat domain-containing protein [Bacteriovoracaceae bacterium]
MSAEEKPSPGPNKKLLENPFVGSLVVPIAIVLTGALIIFGVTKMISTDRSYKDLVREMQSKKFGNRWIAAYELSKLISTKSIPNEDIPWLVGELTSAYDSSKDLRTKEFLVVAAGALGNPLSIPLIQRAFTEPEDPNSQSAIKFHGVVALGNMPKGTKIDWAPVEKFLTAKDEGLKQAAILALASHKVQSSESEILNIQNQGGKILRFVAATALVHYRNEASIPVLQELLKPGAESLLAEGFTAQQVQNLKLNALAAIDRVKWSALRSEIEEISDKEPDVKVVTKARKILNELKK